MELKECKREKEKEKTDRKRKVKGKGRKKIKRHRQKDRKRLLKRYVSHDFIQVCDVTDIFYAQARTKGPIAHHNRDSIKARTIFCC